MRTGAAAGHEGYFHEAAFYDDDQGFVDLVAPFVLGGLDAGEPTIVACTAINTALLEDALDCRDVTFLPGADHYARPGPTIKDYRAMFGRLTRGGASQIRVVGDVPHPGVGMDWTGWMHYEAAVNVAYDDFPIWGLCPYDRRTAPDDVLDDVRCSHPWEARPGGHHVCNDAYEPPAAFLARRPDPVEDLGPPALELHDVGPADARRAIDAEARSALDDRALEVLLLVTSELVANAVEHGTAPTTARLFVGEGAATVAVADLGRGPLDPLAGWIEPDLLAEHGRGLWIVNQLASDLRVDHRHGYEVRATVTVERGRTATTR